MPNFEALTIDQLPLTRRTRARLKLKFGDISPEELRQKTDKEILKQPPTHWFGERSLKELREKLATYPPQVI